MSGDAPDRRAVFDDLFASDPDPWGFESSPYERAKRERTVAALRGARFSHGLEIGCATGVLARELAPFCDHLLALDVSERAIAIAKARSKGNEAIRYVRGEVPGDWPSGSFDLIVLSEVLYFLSVAEIEAVSRRSRSSLSDQGVCLLVNWTGENDLPVAGSDAVAIFANAADWHSEPFTVEPTYRIDRLSANG